jgi:peptidoglycan/xylan/chitin deacetylase (PgdA/CDA1 family)
MSWRPHLKRLAEGGLTLSGYPAVSRHTRRGDVLILAYHNVLPTGTAPEGAGEQSLHLPQAEFAAQLDLLSHTHDVVSLDDVLRHPLGRRARPRAVITFDDAYRGAVTIGVRELVERSLPATIFVAPAFLGGRSFWWDALTEPGARGLDEAFRERALEEFQGKDEPVRRWAEHMGRSAGPVAAHATCTSEDELQIAASQPGITIGSHSWSHPNLARLEAGELREELARTLQWLRERFQRVVPYLSYPYGRSSRAVERAALATGYTAGLRIEGGWMRGESANRFALPRLNVPAGLSRNGFALRAAGLFCR